MEYTVKDPQGNPHVINGPDNATPDQVLAQAKKLIPQKQMGGKPPLGFVAKQMWGIMPQNPKNELKNLPLALGALGGASPIPGGASMGTAIGQGIRYAGDKTFNQPVPSGLQHILELGGAALGDAMAIPAMKSRAFGKQIGAAESQYPGMAEVVKEAPPSQARTAVKLAQQLKGKDLSPLEAKRFQPAVNSVYDKGIPFQKAYKMYSPDFAQARQAVSQGLNKIPGRAAPAAGMARAMTIPNFLRDAKQTVWQNPVLRRLIYAVLTGAGIGEGAKLTGFGPK